mmetsp:Transcript_15883/g.26590  ORF Transcript_15883/g.26590 Transcript_15883/m.26590 type:complete len:122 (+) Transcript_15883:155-520(+)
MSTDKPRVPCDEEDNSLEEYSLNGVSFKDFLFHFYTKFNPEKIGMIDYIAQEYEGDEMIMISNLADKYQLSHAEMQRLIDAERLVGVTTQCMLEVRLSTGLKLKGDKLFQHSNNTIQTEKK